MSKATEVTVGLWARSALQATLVRKDGPAKTEARAGQGRAVSAGFQANGGPSAPEAFPESKATTDARARQVKLRCVRGWLSCLLSHSLRRLTRKQRCAW